MTIDRLTLNDAEARSADLVAENVAALKALFPAAVADERIDFDTLRQLLGDEVDDGDERYGLTWPGKRRARRLALTPSTGTLRPAREDSVDWDSTHNLMIEGDNLEVLKLLQKSYASKVNLIYIDPPYNTGSDFVYPDSYEDSLSSYLLTSGQVDGNGGRSGSNPETGGRFHSSWLSMIYPRLLCAKNLLSNDGLIFISIDEHESANLRSICDEIFGPENFIAEIVWEKIYTTKNDATHISDAHEYIYIFAKNVDQANLGLLPRSAEMDARYTNPDNDARGPWKAIPFYARGERKNGRYAIRSPLTGKEHWPEPDSHWRSPEAEASRLIEDGRIYFGKDGNGQPNFKRFLTDVQQGVKPKSLWTHQEVGSNDTANAEMKSLYDVSVSPFSFAKPTKLIKRVLEVGTDKNAIVMDFFAGSGTTGHATIAQNAADNGHRKYILVQLPEPVDPGSREQKIASDFCDKLNKPRNIAELTKERLRRAAVKVKADYPETQADLGFRVYKLAASNLLAWKPSEDLAADLLAAADNIVQGRTEDDLLTELLLKQGIDLTEPMLTETIAGAPVHAMGGGVLVVCLAPVTAANAEALADDIANWILQLNPVAATTVFFKDAGFENDVAKANVAAILEQRLEDQLLKVRSL